MEPPVEISILGVVDDPPPGPPCSAYLAPIVRWSSDTLTIGMKACSDAYRRQVSGEWVGVMSGWREEGDDHVYWDASDQSGCTAQANRFGSPQCESTLTVRSGAPADLDAGVTLRIGYAGRIFLEYNEVGHPRHDWFRYDCWHDEGGYVNCYVYQQGVSYF